MSDYTIQQGATFRARLVWMQPTFSVKAITGISQSVRPVVSVTAHGIPADVDWPVWIRGVKGMGKVNHEADQVGDHALAFTARRVTDDTLLLFFDTTEFAAYSASGELIYQPPVDLTGCSARMQVRKRLGDAAPVLSLLSSGNSPASRLIMILTSRVNLPLSKSGNESTG